MRVLIVGASKGIGFETARQALEAGYHVRALARPATAIRLSNPRLERVRGDALKSQDVEAALTEDKSRQERLVKESALDWTITRPGVLTGGPRTGRYKVLEESAQWRNGIISRSDVADFLVRQIADQTYMHKAPVLVC